MTNTVINFSSWWVNNKNHPLLGTHVRKQKEHHSNLMKEKYASGEIVPDTSPNRKHQTKKIVRPISARNFPTTRQAS